MSSRICRGAAACASRDDPLGSQLGEVLKFKLKPYAHQLEALSVTSDAVTDYALFWEMGTGKTGGCINILRQRYYSAGSLLKTLILSPLITLENWKREFAMHSTIPEKDILVLNKSGKVKEKNLIEATRDLTRPMVIITNHESMQRKTFVELILEYAPTILVVDESHLFKNYKSVRAKNAVKIADICKYRYALTGTPILNSTADLFMQFRILDGGATFGKSFWKFRMTYFFDANAKWSGRPGHFPKWEERDDMAKELSEKIYAKAMRKTKEECLDLPPLIKETLDIALSPEQARLYKEMKRDFITWVESKKTEPQAVVATIALTKALRLMQIVCGFVTTEEGELIDLGMIPRLEATKDLLEQLTPNHKVIVWCSFKHNYKQLGDICEKLKIGHVFLTGDQNAAGKQESMDAFERQDEIRCIIANRRAGGIGVNLVSASYSIVYSRNFSLGEEKQSEARNHRGGSERHDKITKIELITRGTVDETVGIALEGKQKLSDMILDPEKI